MALLSKEMRECSLYAALALLLQMQCLGDGMGFALIPLFGSGNRGEIPFASSTREPNFTMIAVGLAIVLGLHQSMWDSWRQTTLFLLHRPMPRNRIFLAKILAGILLIVAVTAVPLAVYALWAATPGTHASPFFWGMAEFWWRTLLVALICYAGAFLAGLRPAHWIGSKTWPLLTALILGITIRYLPIWWPLVYLVMLALFAALLVSILDTAKRREYP